MVNQANVNGKFLCPYTGEWYDIKKAQVDHIVPTDYAWTHGADKWSHALRVKFYNDPRNLLLVYGPVNQSKGNKDPGKWMPTFNKDKYLNAWNVVCNEYKVDCNYQLIQKLQRAVK